jgi:hypothetical protein
MDILMAVVLRLWERGINIAVLRSHGNMLLAVRMLEFSLSLIMSYCLNTLIDG